MLLLLGTAGAVAGPGPAAVAELPGVEVTSIQQFGPDSDGSYDIVGALRNGAAAVVGPVRVDFSFYASDNRLLSTDHTYAYVDRLAPGETSPFKLGVDPVPGYDHYSYSLSDGAYGALNHNFSVAVTNRVDDFFTEVTGTVRNENTTTASFVQIVGTAVDTEGRVVDAARAFVNNSDASLAPGTSGTYKLTFFGQRAISRVDVLAQSTSPASSASPAPTPTPSAGSPSPSAGDPTSSPTPAPSTAAPSTPLRVSLSPGVIGAGQPVTASYSGAPGDTVHVLSKTQPATGYSKISTVVLDATGRASTTHRPQKNTRITARTVAGVASGDLPLVQVRSVASLNSQRVSPLTYRFSGRVYPALDQRLVSLYRNGVLFAQARTDSTGVFTLTKTLARGSASFQARTKDDVYNVGSSSPVRTLSAS